MDKILEKELEAIEASTKKLLSALEFSTQLQKIVTNFVGFSYINKFGIYETVNTAYAFTCGYRPIEMESTLHWTKTVHTSSLEVALEGYQEMLKEGEAYIDLVGVKKDGTLFNKKVVIITRFDIDKNPDGHYCLMLERPGKVSE